MIGVFVGFSRIFLLGILILKGSLRDVFISRSALKGYYPAPVAIRTPDRAPCIVFNMN
jgi:hypothetical protein